MAVTQLTGMLKKEELGSEFTLIAAISVTKPLKVLALVASKDLQEYHLVARDMSKKKDRWFALNSLFDDKKQKAIIRCLGIEECVRTNIFFLCSDNMHPEDEKNGITTLSALKMATNGLELQSQYVFSQSKYAEFKRCTSIRVFATEAKENYVLAAGDTMLVILLFDKDMQITEFHRIKGLHSGVITDFEVNHFNLVTACPKDSLLSVVQLQNNFQNASTIDFTKYTITKVLCPKDSKAPLHPRCSQ